ncbi:MAG TPA: antibiotic biosynthesis monooxygenase family protein [Pseudonocardiaceae bacterium]|jgi:heme-degrading monooxygenase HmoA|nr:antibiotic biosynthesis monooxygenase family protein [Pseudonocardiaceae bacterium]
MIRSILVLRAKVGRAQAVEDFYRERGIIERSEGFPGCRGTMLLRSTDDGPETHVVVADWDDADAYGRWVADPWRDAVTVDLMELLDTASGPVVGKLYEAVAAPQPAPLIPEELS